MFELVLIGLCTLKIVLFSTLAICCIEILNAAAIAQGTNLYEKVLFWMNPEITSFLVFIRAGSGLFFCRGSGLGPFKKVQVGSQVLKNLL